MAATVLPSVGNYISLHGVITQKSAIFVFTSWTAAIPLNFQQHFAALNHSTEPPHISTALVTPELNKGKPASPFSFTNVTFN